MSEKEPEIVDSVVETDSTLLNNKSIRQWLAGGNVSTSSTGLASKQAVFEQYSGYVKDRTKEIVDERWFFRCLGNIAHHYPQLLKNTWLQRKETSKKNASLNHQTGQKRNFKESKIKIEDDSEFNDTSGSSSTSMKSLKPSRKIKKNQNSSQPRLQLGKLFSKSRLLTTKNLKLKTNTSKSNTSLKEKLIKIKERDIESKGSLEEKKELKHLSDLSLENDDGNNDVEKEEHYNENSLLSEGDLGYDEDDENGDADNDEEEDNNENKTLKLHDGKKKEVVIGPDLNQFGGDREGNLIENSDDEEDEEEEDEEEDDNDNGNDGVSNETTNNGLQWEEETTEMREEKEKQVLNGKTVKELKLSDFNDPDLLKPTKDKSKNKNLPLPIPLLHYRLALKLLELMLGSAETCKPTKHSLAPSRRRILHKQGTSYTRYWPIGGTFPLTNKGSRHLPTVRKRVNFVIRQLRSSQAALGFVLEVLAQTMNPTPQRVLPALTSAIMVIVDQMTAARREWQWLEDPGVAKGLEQAPEDEEQPFDEEDEQTIKNKNDKRKQQQQLRNDSRGRSVGSGGAGSGAGSIFGGRSPGRGRGYRGSYSTRPSSRPPFQRGPPQTGRNNYQRAGSAGGYQRERGDSFAAKNSARFGSNEWSGGGSNNSGSDNPNYNNSRRGRGRGKK
jgi:hypothetical protein